jgi:uncharacterized protein
MKRLSLLIKPASSLCNMRCRYCFYQDIGAVRETSSYGIMSDETRDAVIDNVFKDVNDGDEITFAFQGGEPSLAGLSWFSGFVEKAASQNRNAVVRYAFQTNGLLINEQWCEFFHENDFLIGLSVDASPRFHDRNRLSASGGGTYHACMQTKELLEKCRVEYNILCVLTNDLAKEPEKAWRFIQNEKIRYIQFIPCLEPPGTDRGSPENVLRPARFAKFYSRLLRWWIEELERGNYISVKFFDDVAHYFQRGVPAACGIDGQCHNQYVVEADGGVYPCDFYALDRYKIGNLVQSTPRTLFDGEKTREFINEKPELPAMCGDCGFFGMCRGGCKRMRNVMYVDAGGIVCGYRAFLEKSLEPLQSAVRRVFQ